MNDPYHDLEAWLDYHRAESLTHAAETRRLCPPDAPHFLADLLDLFDHPEIDRALRLWAEREDEPTQPALPFPTRDGHGIEPDLPF